MFVLKRRRLQFDVAVCAAVDKCLDMIAERFRTFFAQRVQAAEMQMRDALKDRKFVWSNQWFDRLVPLEEFEEIQAGIRREIQREIYHLFGIASLEVAAVRPHIKAGYCRIVSQAYDECLQTLFIVDEMTKMGNKLWTRSLEQLPLPSLAGRLLEECQIGARFMKQAGCDAVHELERSENELTKRVRGIVRNIEHAAARELSQATAHVFYELADEIAAVGYDNRMAILQRSAASAVPKPTLYLVG